MVTKANTNKTHSRITSATNNARGTTPNTNKRKSPSGDPDEKAATGTGTGKRKNNNNGKMIGQSSNCFCGICFDFKTDSEMFRKSECNHPFCTDCISKHVAAQINNNVVNVNCPDPDCSVELKPEHLQPILPEELMVQWESASCESSIAWGQKTYCPFKNCSVLLVDDGGEAVTSAECPSCHRLFCAQCKVPWHAGMTCEELKGLKKEKDSERKFLRLAKRENWKRCPQCSIYVEKIDGCQVVRCSRCQCNFCYHCGEEWKTGVEHMDHWD